MKMGDVGGGFGSCGLLLVDRHRSGMQKPKQSILGDCAPARADLPARLSWERSYTVLWVHFLACRPTSKMMGDEAVAVVAGANNVNFTITGVGRTAVDAHRAKTSVTTNPLVQIGYRIRTRTLQEIVERFFLDDEEDRSSSAQKNLLVIGAGLDVAIGWHTVQSRRNVAVVELDLPDVCHAKRLLLEETGTSSECAAIMDWMPFSGEDGIGSSGWVVCCRGTCRSTGSSYTLIATDLNHCLDEKWQNQLLALLMIQRPRPRPEEEGEEDLNNHNKSNNDDDCETKKKNAKVVYCFETLVISELVLTYLSPWSCDALLRFLAHQQKGHQFHLVAYEPLGGGNDGHDDDSQFDSVVASYRAEYRQRFCEKLSWTSSPQNNNGSDTTMTPLGNSLRHVRDRMRRLAGFGYSHARYPTATAADFRSSTNTNNDQWLFDEHAALALHLRSYVVSISSHDLLTRHRLSSYDDPRPRAVTSLSTKVWLCRCCGDNNNSNDHDDDIDETIRSAFRQSYEPYFVQYPAIRRLCDHVVGCNGSLRSSIGGWYRRHGGAFWMLVAKADNDDNNAPTTTVVGGLGLRRLDHAEATKRKLPTATTDTTCFEMERVFIVPAFRGRGLSKVLLDAALKFAGHSSTIVAVTLSVLTEANGLYAKRGGFAVTATETKGSLTYCTYTRSNGPGNEP
jgi:O-methyltransferase involved in polyketide biosynthesis/GNAT superfamily N-acetyltransferase